MVRVEQKESNNKQTGDMHPTVGLVRGEQDDSRRRGSALSNLRDRTEDKPLVAASLSSLLRCGAFWYARVTITLYQSRVWPHRLGS